MPANLFSVHQAHVTAANHLKSPGFAHLDADDGPAAPEHDHRQRVRPGPARPRAGVRRLGPRLLRLRRQRRFHTLGLGPTHGTYGYASGELDRCTSQPALACAQTYSAYRGTSSHLLRPRTDGAGPSAGNGMDPRRGTGCLTCGRSACPCRGFGVPSHPRTIPCRP